MSKPNRSLVAHWKNGLLEKETSFSLHEEQTHLHIEELVLVPPDSSESLLEASARHCGSLA